MPRAVGFILFQLRTPVLPVIKDYSVLPALVGTLAPEVSLDDDLRERIPGRCP